MSYSIYISGHSADATGEEIVAAAQDAFDAIPGATIGSVSGSDGAGASFSGSLVPRAPVEPPATEEPDAPEDDAG